MTTRIFTRAWLDSHRIALESPNPLVLHREMAERQECTTIYTVVFKHEGKFWQVRYQERDLGEVEADTWFDADEVKATEVWPVPVVATQWTTAVTGIDPAPTCQHLTERGAVGDCPAAAVWMVAYLDSAGVRQTDLCDPHLHDALRIQPEVFDIREVRHW